MFSKVLLLSSVVINITHHYMELIMNSLGLFLSYYTKHSIIHYVNYFPLF